MGKKIQWIDETNINKHQKDGKRKVWRRGTAHDLKKHPTSSVKNGSGSVMQSGCQWNQAISIY